MLDIAERRCHYPFFDLVRWTWKKQHQRKAAWLSGVTIATTCCFSRRRRLRLSYETHNRQQSMANIAENISKSILQKRARHCQSENGTITTLLWALYAKIPPHTHTTFLHCAHATNVNFAYLMRKSRAHDHDTMKAIHRTKQKERYLHNNRKISILLFAFYAWMGSPQSVFYFGWKSASSCCTSWKSTIGRRAEIMRRLTKKAKQAAS